LHGSSFALFLFDNYVNASVFFTAKTEAEWFAYCPSLPMYDNKKQLLEEALRNFRYKYFHESEAVRFNHFRVVTVQLMLRESDRPLGGYASEYTFVR